MKDPVLHSLVRNLGHIFRGNVGKKLGVIVKGKGPGKTKFAYDIVRIHSLMIYTDLIEYNIFVGTKPPLLRCFPFIPKLKSGDIITTGQYMNYQAFSNLHIEPLLKISFHSIHIDLRESFQQNLLNNPVGQEKTFLQTFLVDHVKQKFSVPTFCGSVWKSWRESPNC